MHISCSIDTITLIWVSLERSFPLAELEYRGCQFYSKVMTGGYGSHRHQWVYETNFSGGAPCAVSKWF